MASRNHIDILKKIERIGTVVIVVIYMAVTEAIDTLAAASIGAVVTIALLFGLWYGIGVAKDAVLDNDAEKAKAHEVDEPEPQYPGAISTIPMMKRIDPEPKTVNVPVVDEEPEKA